MKITGWMIALVLVASCADDGAEDMQSTGSPATAATDAGAPCPLGKHVKCDPPPKGGLPVCSCR